MMSIAQTTRAFTDTATLDVDDWTRMETRLVLYKTERLMSEIERELRTLRARVEDPSICDTVSETFDLVDHARAVVGALRARL
jgi:hypothetical protein